MSLALARIRRPTCAPPGRARACRAHPATRFRPDPDWAGGSLYSDDRSTIVHADAETLWRVVEGLGGDQGYYSFPLAWEVRGVLDRASGGVGLARGRRNPRRCASATRWTSGARRGRVPGRLLRLRGEFRVPGLAWLELSIRPTGLAGGRPATVYRQRAVFHPAACTATCTGAACSPFHGVIFGSMLRNIRARPRPSTPPPPAVRRPRDVTHGDPSISAPWPLIDGGAPVVGVRRSARQNGGMPETTPYDLMGGEQFFTILVHRFYEGRRAGPGPHADVPRRGHGGRRAPPAHVPHAVLGRADDVLRRGGHPRLRMRHAPYPVDDVACDHWLDRMREALDATMADLGLDPALEQGSGATSSAPRSPW